ncbi:MAG: ATP-grasp domain-containing protein [Candidatus Thorarchaeota archaeon]|nr:ATP-grasp domain-containing protein [Candidatus Thorarchaeota archaeon]
MKAEGLIRPAEVTIFMTSNISDIVGRNIGVIGFNARPIAASLKQLGAKTFVSDYWGDLDLKESSHDCIAILAPKPGIRQRKPLEMPLHQALVENYLHLTKEIDIDFVVIGSGFDDYSESLKPIEESGKLIGNSIETIKRARDHTIIDRISSKLKLKRPKECVINEISQISECVEELAFPCLIRPMHSGGGLGIRFIHSNADISKVSRIVEKRGEMKIQQYISGMDTSTSVLSSTNDAFCITVQGQLIGMPSAGSNCGFKYCGNYYPTSLDESVRNRIARISESLIKELHLIGSNGLDFIVDNSNNIYLLEVNPRIQGTLEMIERASGSSLTQLHLQAISGDIRQSPLSIRPAVKMIVYSRKRGSVPNLKQFPNTFDRSPEGVLVEKGDPICTIIEVEDTLQKAFSTVCIAALNIQNLVQ